MKLSDRLREAMADAEVTQVELARAVGVKPPSVHGWLSGKSRFLRGENLLKAAARLGVNDQWLATGSGPKRRGEAAAAAIVSASQPAGQQRITMRAAARLIERAREMIIGTYDEEALIDSALDAVDEVGPERILSGEGLHEALKAVAARLKAA